MSFFKKKDKIDFITLPAPDNTTLYFQQIKILSEQYWSVNQPNENIYGFQIQQNTIWKPGLSDADLLRFQNIIGFVFPEPLKNFYKVMNGLSKPGINLYGNDGTTPTFSPVFYSYPQDINSIKELIKWFLEANLISKNEMLQLKVSRIFPICWHRFLLIDIPGNPILSMFGDDVIYCADNLSKLLANELFENIYNVHDFENLKDLKPDIKFWLDQR
ncbi:SMI1/KNR4 family protein [Mucilaginibacter limnophilus]|uniref:SMI1/KNR4 family protein n=1 Tax=Mucilaginibacter limnophilus TaxID=1932778 RepID=A0A437MS94_9SPHI|nr:SMI1/KNR4 family protein [Mucilaginibacter limnophilus]RVU00520.1 SMI1/KNR4 family protein [Mucilaginibacter limnophilus]